MKTILEILSWLDKNRDSFMVEFLSATLIWFILKLYVLKKYIPVIFLKLSKIKLFIYFEFVLIYCLPILFIISALFDSETKATYQNVCVFIIICCSLIYNLLIKDVRSIYKMIEQLATKNIEDIKDIDNINKTLNNRITKIENKNEK